MPSVPSTSKRDMATYASGSPAVRVHLRLGEENRCVVVRSVGMSELTDRVALVTGSSSGIGEQVARRLSALGASVVVNSSSSVQAGEAVAASLPGDAAYVRADISDPDEANALVDATVERFGRLDILVNNAGWTTVVDHADLDGLTDEILKRTFDVNVFGTWWVTKRAIGTCASPTTPRW